MWSAQVCLVLLFCLTGAFCLDIYHFQVPSYLKTDDEATLECLFDPEGQGIYSVKWFQDGHEFYRFMPSEEPNRLTFKDVRGLIVDLSRSDERNVHIRTISEQATGRYTCEVSGEAPTFQVAKYSANMHVVAPMRHMMASAQPATAVVSWWTLVPLTLVAALAARQ